MNKDNAAQYLPRVKDLSENKLQIRLANPEEWRDCEVADFSCPPEHYRRKPEPIRCKVVIGVKGKPIFIVADDEHEKKLRDEHYAIVEMEERQ